jgi:peptidoglycan hydrolase-like protein with peptidoglycan-binding domain
MRGTHRFTVAALTAAALVGGAASVGYGILPLASSTHASARVAPAPDVTTTPSRATTGVAPVRDESVSTTIAPAPEPTPVLAPGDHGRQVRALQARLAQLAWFTPPITGRYDKVTRGAVAGFQHKRGLRATGTVDQRTWRRLTAMTRQPTGDELFNRAGPALFKQGDHNRSVREIQARLRQIGWFSGDVTGRYGAVTTQAVRGFQAKRHIPITGAVDQRTLDLLESMTHEPTRAEMANKAPDPADGAALDRRCTTGRALCIDKTTRSLRWVVGGTVRASVDVRFGASYTPTREGLFHVYWKDRDHVSSQFGSAMPFSMFFSGGQAVHYSSDFAARGYAGASHGCVNVRDYDTLAALFDQVRVGDKVVVYWS